jgi:hypothetical protein
MVLLRMILQELKRLKKKRKLPGAGWFPPAILAIQEAEISRTAVPRQPYCTNCSQDPISKKLSQEKGNQLIQVE